MSAPNPVCVEGFPGMPASTMLGSPKFGWLKTLKNWASTLSFTCSVNGKPFRKIEITPEEIGTAQGIAAEVSELAILRVVAAGALPRARINGRHKGIRIEPLNRARLRYARNGMMLIERDAGNDTGELRSTALHNAVSVRRIGRAQHRERNPAVPKHGSGNLPAV